MRLGNNCVRHRTIKRLIAFPIIARRIDDDGPNGRSHVVFGRAGVAAIPEKMRVATGVRIDENLIWVESLPRGIRVAIDPVTPVMRQVALMDVPSTRAAITAVRFSVAS